MPMPMYQGGLNPAILAMLASAQGPQLPAAAPKQTGAPVPQTPMPTGPQPSGQATGGMNPMQMMMYAQMLKKQGVNPQGLLGNLFGGQQAQPQGYSFGGAVQGVMPQS